MKVYCTKRFRKEYTSLNKKKKYNDLQGLIIGHFFDKPLSELRNGDPIAISDDVLFLKKRLPDSGSFRVYFYVFIKEDKLYLTWVHPKVGSQGISTIGKEFKKSIQNELLEAKKSGELLIVSLDETKSNLVFKEIDKA